MLEVVDGVEEFIDEEYCLTKLLEAEQLFIFPSEDGNFRFAANCNDLFFWGCADAEIIPYKEIIPAWRSFKATGCLTKWSCMRRKMRPQHTIEKHMKERGEWDAELESLPVREVSFGNPDMGDR